MDEHGLMGVESEARPFLVLAIDDNRRLVVIPAVDLLGEDPRGHAGRKDQEGDIGRDEKERHPEREDDTLGLRPSHPLMERQGNAQAEAGQEQRRPQRDQAPRRQIEEMPEVEHVQLRVVLQLEEALRRARGDRYRRHNHRDADQQAE